MTHTTLAYAAACAACGVLAWSSAPAHAQTSHTPTPEDAAPAPYSVPTRLGVFAPYGVQPGLRATAFYARSLDDATTPDTAWRSQLMLGPELGVFTRPEAHTTALIGAMAGYRLQPPGGCCSHDLILGVAYLAESQIVALSVDLATGETTEQRELRHQVLPTLHYAFGWAFAERWGWYADLGVGQTYASSVPYAFYFSVETGVELRFGAPTKEPRP